LLLRKEAREIFASRAYWLMLALLGPLAGHAFSTAVEVYAEASRGGLPQALSPLDGILVPTFGVYDLAATLFFPFVAIRLAATERENGAWTLLLQAPVSVARMLAAKFVALIAAWIIAWTPGLIAIGLWKWYGGHVHAPELANLLGGYLLRGALTIGVGMAAAAVARSAASAAIATLAFTVGAWALEMLGAVHGGLLETLATYTPSNALRSFETGLLSPAKTLVLAATAAAGVAIAAIWMHSGRRPGNCIARSVVALALLLAMFGAASWIPGSADIDVSEDHRNSFSDADTQALRAVGKPLRITVRLAPEDPRLADLDRNIIAKLTRVLPQVIVTNTAQSRTGLFETANYGEVWYQIDGRRLMTRSTTEPVVLETIYKLAGVCPPAPRAATPYPGYPLNTHPALAFPLLMLLWPVAMAVLCWSFLFARRY
jgi:ABC-2 type transport system permease protein